MQYTLLFASAFALVTCTLAAPRNLVDSDKRLNPGAGDIPKPKRDELKNTSGNGTFPSRHNETHLERLNSTKIHDKLNETDIYNRTHHEEHEHNVARQPGVQRPSRPDGNHEDSGEKHGKHSRSTPSSTPAVEVVTAGANMSNNTGSIDTNTGSNASTSSNVPV